MTEGRRRGSASWGGGTFDSGRRQWHAGPLAHDSIQGTTCHRSLRRSDTPFSCPHAALGIVMNAVRWVLVTVLTLHGLLHVLGVLKGFGWAQVSQLQAPIGQAAGVVWLGAGLLVLAAAGLLATGAPTWWWSGALLAAAVSQIAIATSWSDAKAGTAVNVLLVLAAAYAFASAGPMSFHAQWEQQASRALEDVDATPSLLTEADLADLPQALAAYVRRSGAVGQPRVTSFDASLHGRIRGAPDQAWMPFTGRQISTYGPRPQRAFIMDATRSGFPITVLHQFADTTATMRAKALSLVPVVDAAGPEMDRGETVTVFNDLVMLAPGAIPDAPVRWTPVDAHHVRGNFTDGDQTVSALLTFDDEDELIDFTSDDRLRASADGSSFTPQTWSTPLSEHRDHDGRPILVTGEAQWHAPQPEGTFTYVELVLDDINYNVPDVDAVR